MYHVSPEKLTGFCVQALVAAGADRKEAETVAGILVWCDSVGRVTQGVWRLPILVKRLGKGLYHSPCCPEIEMSGTVTGRCNGNNGMGHYVASVATEHVIETAGQQGIGAVTVRNSNYYGAGGYYACRIAESGMAGLVLSNSFPKVIPHGGRSPALGTNPFSFACPALEGKPLLVDMATSELAGSTVRKAQERGEAEAVPLRPFGGARGYSLSLFVEIMAGVLSGAGVSHGVKSMYENFNEGGGNGHFILALDIERFMPLAQFSSRMHQLIDYLRESGSGEAVVQYPGESRWQALETSCSKGIPVEDATMRKLRQLAEDSGIAFPV